jgi:flagellar basal body-associated protein FliL
MLKNKKLLITLGIILLAIIISVLIFYFFFYLKNKNDLEKYDSNTREGRLNILEKLEQESEPSTLTKEDRLQILDSLNK